MGVTDLGRMGYRAAYARQEEMVERVVRSRDSAEPMLGHVLLVEHDPVVTVSRRPGASGNVVASREVLALAGVEVEETDRGGDVTYHGPGQIVAYPIIDLNAAGLRLHEYMRLLEGVVIEVCARFGVRGERDASATGVWVRRAGAAGGAERSARKIAAMGVRVRRWVSMHGLALNVTTNLQHFRLIVPCGLTGREVTSLREELGERCPSMEEVKGELVKVMREVVEARRES